MIDCSQELIDLRNELAEETKHQIEGAYTLTLRMLARIDARLMTPSTILAHAGRGTCTRCAS